MPEIDDLLELKLSEIEGGRPLEEVISSLPAEYAELGPLLILAATVRTMPHPEPALVNVPVGQSKAVIAIRTAEHAVPAGAHPDTKFQWPHLPISLPGTLAILAAIVVLFVVGFWLAGPRNAHAARLSGLNGTVEISAKGSNQWVAAETGAKLRKGDAIRTIGASTVTLNFFEGSKTVMAPDTLLTVASIDGNWGKILNVELNQQNGRTSHYVVPFRSQKSFYYVQTPSGRASVHGTSFQVDVRNGTSRYLVTTGEVEVTSDSSQVFVNAGQITSSQSSEGLSAPTYQFSTNGPLESMDGSSWVVAGVSFIVTSDTQIEGEPVLGDVLSVEGRMLEDGTNVADTISMAHGELFSSFTGTLEAVNQESWVISGKTLMVNTDTELSSGLAVGDPVKVTFHVLGNGLWQAVAIEPLVDQPPQEQPAQEVTSNPVAKPSLEFVPDEFEASGADTQYTFTGSLWNAAASVDDFASGVSLGYLIVDGADQVDSVVLTPSSFERIDMGQQASFDVQVNLKEGWTSQAKKVKIQVFIASEANRDDHPGKMTVTIEAEPTETPPEETDPGVGAPEEDAESSICQGTKVHPTGMTLSRRYDIPYEELMVWFCQQPHFGFGEIDLAYSLSKETGQPVESIFAMKTEGKGWGQIRDELGVKPGKPEKTPNPNKPVKPDKPDNPNKPDKPDNPNKPVQPNK